MIPTHDPNSGRCEICGLSTQMVYEVLGKKTPLCSVHWRAWDQWGALAGMVALCFKRMTEREDRS